jgi:hypothetical protein
MTVRDRRWLTELLRGRCCRLARMTGSCAAYAWNCPVHGRTTSRRHDAEPDRQNAGRS